MRITVIDYVVKNSHRVWRSDLCVHCGITGINRSGSGDCLHCRAWLERKLECSGTALRLGRFSWIIWINTWCLGCQNNASSLYFNNYRCCPVRIEPPHFRSQNLLSLILQIGIDGQNHISARLSFLNNNGAGWNLDSIHTLLKSFFAIDTRQAGIELPFDSGQRFTVGAHKSSQVSSYRTVWVKAVMVRVGKDPRNLELNDLPMGFCVNSLF